MDAPNGLKAGNVYAMILAFALMPLAFCYWAGRRSVHCATPDPTTEEVLRATVAAQEAELADAHAESERLRAIIDSAEAADFAVIDGPDAAEGGACHGNRPPQLVSISRSFSGSDPVIYLTQDGPADYRIFVQSKTFSMLDAAALIVGARSGHPRAQSASL